MFAALVVLTVAALVALGGTVAFGEDPLLGVTSF